MIGMMVFLLVLCILVSFHEFGHLIVAKMCGMKIDAYSIGFGPKLLKVKLGETEYSLSLILLGGYIKPAGPNFIGDVKSEDPDKNRYFICKSVWKRALVIMAGPVFNFLLAFILLTGMIYHFGAVPEITMTIGEVLENSPAAKAGIQKGDLIIAIDGEKTTDWRNLLLHIQENQDKKITLEIKRNENILNVSVKPESTKEGLIIGIAPTIQQKKVSGLAILTEGVRQLEIETRFQAEGIVHVLTRKISSKNLGGPIAIFEITNTATKEGFLAILGLMIILNIALGLFNLLPIPALDGGQLPLLILEAIIGRPLSKTIQVAIQITGFVMIILILLLATANDISRLIHR